MKMIYYLNNHYSNNLFERYLKLQLYTKHHHQQIQAFYLNNSEACKCETPWPTNANDLLKYFLRL